MTPSCLAVPRVFASTAFGNGLKTALAHGHSNAAQLFPRGGCQPYSFDGHRIIGTLVERGLGEAMRPNFSQDTSSEFQRILRLILFGLLAILLSVIIYGSGLAARSRCIVNDQVTSENGERFYHAPWQQHSERFHFNPWRAEQGYCTPSETHAAGWRPANA